MEGSGLPILASKLVKALETQQEALGRLVSLGREEQAILLEHRLEELQGIMRAKEEAAQQLAAGQEALDAALISADQASEGGSWPRGILRSLADPEQTRLRTLCEELHTLASELGWLSHTNMMLLGYGLVEKRRIVAAWQDRDSENVPYCARGTINRVPLPRLIEGRT